MLRRLGRALAGAGFDVLLLDLAPPPTLADAPLPSLEFAAVDVRDEAGGHSGAPVLPAHLLDGQAHSPTPLLAPLPPIAALAAHFKGASLVFHLASYGMSGGAQLQRRLVEAVNVGGTRAVLAAAVAAGVGRLVYLST